jgi:hypothetical protein
LGRRGAFHDAEEPSTVQFRQRIVDPVRRTAVRGLERAGVSRSVAMRITGHKTEAVYRRYAIVSDADLLAASEKLAGMFSGMPGGSAVESVAQVANLQG